MSTALLQPQPDYARSPPLLPRPFEVVAKRQETPDSWTFELEPRDGEVLAFAPGQFTMLSASGAGEVAISISGDPARPHRLVHTVRAIGLATQAICRAQEGDTLGVRGPFGAHWPIEQLARTDVVIIAGGIGLAPLRPALLAIGDGRDGSGRVTLLYGARTPEDLVFKDELQTWPERGIDVHITVDSAGPEWLGHVGVVTRLIARAGVDSPEAAALICGPEVMMRFVVGRLIDLGVAPERIYVSIERNMQCGTGHCGHCQLGPTLVCRDGPVYRWSELGPWLKFREL